MFLPRKLINKLYFEKIFSTYRYASILYYKHINHCFVLKLLILNEKSVLLNLRKFYNFDYKIKFKVANKIQRFCTKFIQSQIAIRLQFIYIKAY